MTLVLGVDGGGRKTYAVVADEHGEVLGAGQAGASNWEIAGADGARAAIASAVGAAVRRGVERRDHGRGVRSGGTRLGLRRTPADGARGRRDPRRAAQARERRVHRAAGGDVGVVGDRGDRRHRHGGGRPRPGRQRVPDDRGGPGVRRLRRRVRRVGARRPRGRRSLHGPRAGDDALRHAVRAARAADRRGDARAARATRPTVARARAPEPDADGARGDGGGRSRGAHGARNGSARRWAKPPAWWHGG